MAKEKDYSIDELVEMEVFTIKQAQAYVEEKTGMGSGLFYDCVRPELEPKPIAKNYRKKKVSHLVVLKEDVDAVIARMKRKLIN